MKFKVKSSIKKQAADHPIKIYLANLGKYNEGGDSGMWVTLPVESFDPIFEKIGVRKGLDEWFIQDYDAPFKISEYENLEQLNEVAKQSKNFDEIDWIAFSEFIDAGYDINSSLQGVLDHDYTYVEGYSDSDLGANFISDVYGGIEQLDRETLERYFDYDMFGSDLQIEGFHRVDGGFIEINR